MYVCRLFVACESWVVLLRLSDLGESCWRRAAPIHRCVRLKRFFGFLGRFSYATVPVRCRGLIPSLQKIVCTRSAYYDHSDNTPEVTRLKKSLGGETCLLG